ncbi:hypothetical protein F3Y22_tig00110403pilonHSYRG00191 [Hibiscus syriacus]|uniref:Uncharacterized protein n=1 Tax=Hibiscus syriacus TaxID=106335 RepID=A0A6A3AQZ4_HIBSY|nr:hypothetical protein F3Y22_tig00110403pilonHSYRG00191 [Hibiscus syriacus]
MKAFHLDKLSDEDCLSIFCQHALRARNFDGHFQFKQVGDNIVRRCNGLPLAAKAMGGLLCTTNLSEWKRSESEIWDLPEDKCGIIPALRLSYHHLPSHLKCCFAYCSIFPKDYEFEEEIILLWSAEGFLQQKTKLPFKDLGNQYFQDLVSRSFFQISSKDESQYVMHDLINDLAQLVAGDICCRLEENEQQMFSHRCRHSSYIISRYWITELPDCLENLKHLRHFNLSHTQIRCLPDSLCTLYHLETFLLKRCSKLQNLPSKMENLVNLHYLDIRGADLIERMPFGIGNLTNLQRLSDFVIGEGDGHRIGELKNLSNLKGDLCLSGLENVNGRDAWEARLNKKSGINNLVLEWSGDFEPTRKNQVEERVLDSLHPPKKLEQLVIKNFGGAKFSTWITDSSFSNLSSLELRSCKNCKSLPPIGRLSSLKGLSIGGLVEVRKIGNELFGENQSVAFASLESLSFESLPNWEEWDACEGDEQVSKLPMLRKLSIRHCPRLLGRLPTRLQSLQKLEIYECMRLVVSISSYPSLRELSVEGCEELVDECPSSSPGEEVTSLQSVNLSSISKFSIAAERRMLRRMELVNCEGLVSFTESNFPPALKELTVRGCENLQYLFDESMSSNTCLLEVLYVDGCQSLKWLSSRGDICNRLQCLRVYDCPELRSLFLNSKLPVMLKKLSISDCPVLECIAEDFHETTDLERIHMYAVGNIKSLPRGIDKLSHLQEISLIDCSNLVACFDEIGLPTTNLIDFTVCQM